ncbi:MAG TPA: type II secretion system protein GspG [Myxococcaceae bacterium]|nr:type II secretion system protein GspG [Myxococcaceae bacterium]
MTSEPLEHPKHTWKAWRRDVLRALAAFAGLFLVMLALWYGVVAALFTQYDCLKKDTVRLDLKNIQYALKRFHDTHQRFPSTEEGLRALVNDQLLEREPLDPWGFPYGYELRDGQPVLWSHGADGAPGGEGVDADVRLPGCSLSTQQ